MGQQAYIAIEMDDSSMLIIEVISIIMVHLPLIPKLLLTRTCRRANKHKAEIEPFETTMRKMYQSFLDGLNLRMVQVDGVYVMAREMTLSKQYGYETYMDQILFDNLFGFHRQLTAYFPRQLLCRTRISFVYHKFKLIGAEELYEWSTLVAYDEDWCRLELYLCGPDYDTTRRLYVDVSEAQETIRTPLPAQIDAAGEEEAVFHNAHQPVLSDIFITIEDDPIVLPDDERPVKNERDTIISVFLGF